jgi:hypothetical protein
MLINQQVLQQHQKQSRDVRTDVVDLTHLFHL